MEVSIILPVYNLESTIRRNLETLLAFMDQHFPSFELIVVDDGSSDNTRSEVLEVRHQSLRLEMLPENRGKFAALRLGFQRASGDCLIFTDADLPYDLESLPYIVDLVIKRGYHVVTGDRSLAESISSCSVPLTRKIASRIYSHLLRLLLTGGLHDTQCGLKGFSREIGKSLFPLIRDNRFGGDIELMYLALKYNLEIRRIPVRLRAYGKSSVFLPRDGVLVFLRALSLPLLWHSEAYSSQTLRDAGAQYYWDRPLD